MKIEGYFFLVSVVCLCFWKSLLEVIDILLVLLLDRNISVDIMLLMLLNKGQGDRSVFLDSHFGSFYPQPLVLDPHKLRLRVLSVMYMINLKLILLSHLLVAGCDIGVRFSVRLSVSPSVRLSTFMSKFDIYVKVSILINYKTKQPSNLAWNISLTSWLWDIGVCFSIRLPACLSVCQYLCRSLTFMSKWVF